MRFIDNLLAHFRPQCDQADEAQLEWQERKDWMDKRGFRLAFDPFTQRYVTGFDRDEQYEFMRPDWDSPSVFRMADAHPLFNIAGLSFRPIDARR